MTTNILRTIFPRIGIRSAVAIEILSTIRQKGRIKKIGEWTQLQSGLSKKHDTSIANILKTCQIMKKNGLISYEKGYYILGNADFVKSLQENWMDFLKKGQIS